MTPEMITIVSVGLALGAMQLTILQIVLKRIDRFEDQNNDRFDRLEDRVGRLEDRVERLETRMSGLEQRQSKLEGMLDGLREALFDRASR